MVVYCIVQFVLLVFFDERWGVNYLKQCRDEKKMIIKEPISAIGAIVWRFLFWWRFRRTHLADRQLFGVSYFDGGLEMPKVLKQRINTLCIFALLEWCLKYAKSYQYTSLPFSWILGWLLSKLTAICFIYDHHELIWLSNLIKWRIFLRFILHLIM